MAEPPTNPPGTAPPSPPPGYPPYPPYPPYPYYPQPPRRDNLPLIIVIVIVGVVVIPMVLAAVLYVMVSGLLVGPGGPNQRMIALGPVDQTGGNATIAVAYVSGVSDPSSLEFSLRVNSSSSGMRPLPPPDGSVLVQAGGHNLRVFWLDDGNAFVGPGDSFWITGNLVALPAATAFSFILQSIDGHAGASVDWTTA